ncbi:MAG: hypothetical protein AAFY28_16470, partial [Actinomycetota bacterium]
TRSVQALLDETRTEPVDATTAAATSATATNNIAREDPTILPPRPSHAALRERLTKLMQRLSHSPPRRGVSSHYSLRCVLAAATPRRQRVRSPGRTRTPSTMQRTACHASPSGRPPAARKRDSSRAGYSTQNDTSGVQADGR